MTRLQQVSDDASEREMLLAATGLACFRGDRLLFRDLDLTVEAGRVLRIAGPNGSGKSTLLRVLCGLTLPDEGELLWRGHPVRSYSPEFRGDLHYVGHSDGVKLELSPLENLRIAQALGGRTNHAMAREALDRFGLGEFTDVPCRTLSAGQRRRVALARLALGQARLWVLDEPFTALDKSGGATIYALLDSHLGSGGAAVITSHQSLKLDTGITGTIELAP